MNSLPGNIRDDQSEVKETLDQIYQISNFLKCNLDKNTLAIMVSLVEEGIRPEQVAMIVAEIKKNNQ
jgi:mitotic-spindle organizing protein 1